MNRSARHEYLQELSAAAGSPEATLRPVKDLTFANATAFHDAFFDYVKEGRIQIRLELSGVAYIDSGGVGTLVKLRKALEGSGGALTILNPARTVQNVLKLVGLSALVQHEEASARAVAPPLAAAVAPSSGLSTRPARDHLASAGGVLTAGAPVSGSGTEVDAKVDTLPPETPSESCPTGSKQARVEVRENVTYLNAQALLDGLLEHLSRGVTQVRVDVARVEFVDSAGVGILLKAAKAFNGAGGDLILISPTLSLQRILKIVKLDRVLKIEN